MPKASESNKSNGSATEEEFHPRYLPDQWTLADELHFGDCAEPLVEVALSAATPLTLGVHGPWGCGKTSLLQMVRHEIEERGGDDIRTTWFTAWKYDKQHEIWRTLILRVIDSLHPRIEGKPISIEEADDSTRPLIERLNRLAQSLYTDVAWEDPEGWSINVAEGLRLPLPLLPDS